MAKTTLLKLNYQPSGGKTWVAEITGRCEKYKYERKFLKYVALDKSGSGKTGQVTFQLEQGKFYQVREAWQDDCFVNGEGLEVGVREVLDYLDKTVEN